MSNLFEDYIPLAYPLIENAPKWMITGYQLTEKEVQQTKAWLLYKEKTPLHRLAQTDGLNALALLGLANSGVLANWWRHEQSLLKSYDDMALQYASEELRNNIDIVSAAVTHDGMA